LLPTSSASRKREVPLYISMQEISVRPDPALYNQSSLPVGVLLEGSFESFYENYPVPEGVYPPDCEVIGKSDRTSVFVAADGDLVRNEVEVEQGAFVALPLGYDKYTRQTFGNREFAMNVVNYMTDEMGIMELRAREFKLRLLDREVINDQGAVLRWKLINTLVPILLVILSGIGIMYYRRKRFAG
ncbi:MAG: hypothetical protein R6U78_17445, partial [Bacteroidales bacterium]